MIKHHIKQNSVMQSPKEESLNKQTLEESAFDVNPGRTLTQIDKLFQKIKNLR